MNSITVDDFVGRALVYHALRHPPAGDWTQAVQRGFNVISEQKKSGKSPAWQLAKAKQAMATVPPQS